VTAVSQPVPVPQAADKTAQAAHVPTPIEARFVARLPQFITMFFSFTMVGFFRTFTDTFHFTTAPSFNIRDGSQDLIVISFFVTLFWIVTAWIGYSMLIERYPYTLDLGRFFFDIARFSLLNFQMNFAFLAGQIAYFQVYIFSIGLWHAMMMFWYILRARRPAGTGGRPEAQRDAVSHGLRMGTYVVLGLLYYFLVATRVALPGANVLRFVIAGVTFAIMVAWNFRRIREITARAVVAPAS
jgi:hypothetical protein